MLVFVSVLGLLTSKERTHPVTYPIIPRPAVPQHASMFMSFLGTLLSVWRDGAATLAGGWGQGPLASSRGEPHCTHRMCFHCVTGHLEGPSQAISFKCLVLEMSLHPGGEVAEVTHK